MVPASCPQPDSPTGDACIALFTCTSARDLVEAATARVFTLLSIVDQHQQARSLLCNVRNLAVTAWIQIHCSACDCGCIPRLHGIVTSYMGDRLTVGLTRSLTRGHPIVAKERDHQWNALVTHQ